jgi:hypothetical protein
MRGWTPTATRTETPPNLGTTLEFKMSMSKKDYVAMAAAVKASFVTTPERRAAAAFVNGMRDHFAKQKDFDWPRFVEACGLAIVDNAAAPGAAGDQRFALAA